MDESQIPAEFVRVGLGSEAVKQKKYQRWASEMARHGWDVHQPSANKVRSLAIQNARERFEARVSDTRA